MERLLLVLVMCMGMGMGMGIGGVRAEDSVDGVGACAGLEFAKAVDCFANVMIQDIGKAEGSAEDKAGAVKTVLKGVQMVKKFEGKLGGLSDLTISFEILKMMLDIVEQSDQMGANGTGCRNYYVYAYSKDINIYSKFWMPSSKLDNGTGLKQNGALERTLGVFTAPIKGEAQLRSKEYFGMVDRKLVEVKEGKLTYVNDDLVVVMEGEETGCGK